MEKRLMTLLAGTFLFAGSVMAQTNVSGTVTSSEDGEPVVGAAVKVEGTNTGTVTDVNGHFQLNAPAGAKLVVSYLGMKPQTVKAGGNMKVVLVNDNKTLDEVMVVAYGKQKKSSFTGSAAEIKADKLADRQVANLTQALTGEVAGVQVTVPSGKPGETASVRIRGIGSFSSSNAPLYVVDGVPYDGEISAINPNDIASLTVLKDAAANALYGARGANGVILVTTKSGKTGEAQVTFDAKIGHESRAVSNYDVIKSPATYMEKAYEAIYNSGIGQGLTAEQANQYANRILPTNGNGGVGYTIFTVPDGESLIGKDGKINPKATLGYKDKNYTYLPDNWYDEVYNKSNVRQEYNATVSGKGEKISYFTSAGYLNDEGVVKNSGFERFTTRSKVDYQVKPWLKLTSNVAYTHYNSNYSVTNKDDWNSTSSGNIFYVANFMSPVYPLYVRDANGKIMKDANGFTIYDYGDGKGLTDYAGSRTFMSGSNPASSGQLDKNKYSADVLSGRWGAEFDIYDGLTFNYNLGLDIDHTNRSTLYNAFYGQYAGMGGSIYKYAYTTKAINHQFLLNYAHNFGKHSVTALLGHERYDFMKSELYGNKNKLYFPDVMELDNALKTPTTGSSTDRYSTRGWFGRVQYNYDEKYFASVSYRRDGSSRFAKDSRWGDFGSVGAAWVISKEAFMEPTKDWLTFLKYKISYGVQGNDNLLLQGSTDPNYYPYEDIYRVVNLNDEAATALYVKGNPDITWETSYSFNTGFDFNLWNGKLSGSVEYYNRTTDDLLYYMPVAVSNGYAYFPKNVGKVRNFGFEFDLNSDVYKTKDITVSLYANATTMTNRIEKLAPELKGRWIDGTSLYREGGSMYNYYMRKFAGVYTGSDADKASLVAGETAEKGQALYYVDQTDANGKVTGVKKTTNWAKATQYELGDRLPDVYGGFGVKVAAYGFDFSISTSYQLGGKCRDWGYQTLMHAGSANNAGSGWHKDILNSWSEANPNSNIPRVDSNDQYASSTSDRFLVSSNYLDIDNISFGYNFPRTWVNRIGLKGLRLYFTADNVALFAKRKGLDPRQSYSSATGMNYSALRTVSGGVTVKF